MSEAVRLSEIVGRTIMQAWQEPDESNGNWTDCGGHLHLELDDGTTVDAVGWGHDAWGCEVTIQKPK